MLNGISILCGDAAARVIAGLLTGLILGSFTTMLSYRLPRGLSIIWPGSHCPSCKTRLRPIDLLPVLSWVLQRGRCRHCGAPIGWRYLLIEIAVTLAVIAAFGVLGCTLRLILALGAIVTLVTGLAIHAGWRQPG
ncbi:MAG TPA: prepilin peptidase [Methylocella sp.]|nr:prepilin peptidase [Methylocella sp.]